MPVSLANAVSSDNSLDNIVLMAECLFLMGLVFALAAVPIVLANRRRAAGVTVAGNMMAVVVLWGLLTCGTALYSLMMQYQWTKNYNAQLMTGYFDPLDPATTSGAPKQPWIVWGGLAAGYVGLLAWSVWPLHPRQ
jgi:hypothetical protein